ncbi:MAG: hypothetical protein ABI411_20365 [Tahibacter sp.]
MSISGKENGPPCKWIKVNNGTSYPLALPANNSAPINPALLNIGGW